MYTISVHGCFILSVVYLFNSCSIGEKFLSYNLHQGYARKYLNIDFPESKEVLLIIDTLHRTERAFSAMKLGLCSTLEG